MNTGGHGRPRQVDHRIEQLCARLAESSGPLATPGPMRERARSIAAAIRAGRPPADLDTELDELEDLLLRNGFAAGLSSSRSTYTTLPGIGGIGGGHPSLEVLACPADACDRMQAPDPSAPAPTCAVLGQPLRLIRLRP
ncbi:hypothetical protein ACQP0C_10135 [Nocardia sp. CA-129566]|uniref:hypothetical protein n=1 Tax=Nocardia sp. CA-129566 TaxID=3239976 RepID=UPI003D98DBC4